MPQAFQAYDKPLLSTWRNMARTFQAFSKQCLKPDHQAALASTVEQHSRQIGWQEEDMEAMATGDDLRGLEEDYTKTKGYRTVHCIPCFTAAEGNSRPDRIRNCPQRLTRRDVNLGRRTEDAELYDRHCFELYIRQEHSDKQRKV
jgi:hypothetical protein